MSVAANLKRLIGVWALVWPLVTFGLWTLNTVAPALPTAMKTLVLTALLVPAISLVIAPFVTRRLTGE